MAITTQEVDMATCDACGAREYSSDGQFRGVTGVAASGLQGFAVNWYSCKGTAGHVGAAVKAAIDAGPQEDDDQ